MGNNGSDEFLMKGASNSKRVISSKDGRSFPQNAINGNGSNMNQMGVRT